MQDMQTKIAEYRQKAAAGTLTNEEMREAIAFLRQGRTAATTAAKKKGTSKKVVNSNELLAELEGL